MKIFKKAIEISKKMFTNRYVQATACGFLGVAGAEVAKRLFREDKPFEPQPEVEKVRITSYEPMELMQEGSLTFRYMFRTPCPGGYDRFSVCYSRPLTEEQVMEVVAQKDFADALRIALDYDFVKVETLRMSW